MNAGNASSTVNSSLHSGQAGPATPAPDAVSKNQVYVDAALATWKRRIQRAEDDEKRKLFPYWLNFGLLMTLVVLCWIYYLRHLEQLFTQAMFVGIPITALGAWQVLREWAPSGPLAEDQRSLAQRILRDRWATQWLLVALVGVSLALGMTTSIYLTFADDSDKTAEVAVLAGTQKLRENLIVSSNQPVQGGQYYFRDGWLWHPVDLHLVTIRPFGYQLKPHLESQRLRSFTSVNLKFPDDFEKTEYYIVRLIPGKGLQAISPSTGPSAASVYNVEIQVDGVKQTSDDASYDCFYFGATEEAVEALRNEEPSPARLERMKGAISNLGLAFDKQQSNAESLARSKRFIKTSALSPGNQISVAIFLQSKKVGQVDYKIKESGIQDLVIGIEP